MTGPRTNFDDPVALVGGPNQEFTRLTNLVKTEHSATKVSAYADLDERHHQFGGVVHGGVYSTIVEAVAGFGSNVAAAQYEADQCWCP